MLKIVSIVGARPNFMKVAPLIHEMEQHADISHTLVHTGQHYDDNLSKIFFDELNIPRPDIDLGIGSGEREEQIRRIQEAFEPILLREPPDLLVVVGDVNSTIACARVAKRHNVDVAHVEAGLRSFDLSMPEERNRIETDEISDYLFVTEESGLQNLESEGIQGRRYLVGNVMIDTLMANLPKASRSRILEDHCLSPRDYMVATFHRPSNVDREHSLSVLIDSIAQLCTRSVLVLPLHPRTRESLRSFKLLDTLERIDRLLLTEPLGYLDFLKLVSQARAVITDSGGIQEETTFLGIPCLTMRENTERPTTITVGTNVLVGSSQKKLLVEADKVIGGQQKEGRIPPYWDGNTAPRIVGILKQTLLPNPR